MQPLIEEVLEIIRSKDQETRKVGFLLIGDLANLQYASSSYDERLRSYSHVPERYLAICLFDDEWGQIAHFLSRLFIEDFNEVTEEVIFYLGKLNHEDAFEPLLDIILETPEKLDGEYIGFQLMLSFQKLIGRSRSVSKRKTKKLLAVKNPAPFFKRWTELDDLGCFEAGKNILVFLKEEYGIYA